MKLFLIDGHALIFKMYYAFMGRTMVNTRGVDTSILFGFTKYLLELIEREKPTHVAVSFDPPGGTFRNKLYPAYKANRGETPKLVIDALEPLTDIVKALGIPVLMIPGFEADDVIGSAAKRFRAEGFQVYMVTPDKDYGQLVQDGIMQYRPGKAGENEILGTAEICGKWGIETPLQVIDILTICGDSSDNVPGVQGVGPVGAANLLRKYHSVDGIYKNIAELTPRQRTLFEAASDHIGLSRELVTIKTDIELDVTASDMALKPAVGRRIIELFDLYEFGSLKRRLPRVDDSIPTGPTDSTYAGPVAAGPGGSACSGSAASTGPDGSACSGSALPECREVSPAEMVARSSGDGCSEAGKLALTLEGDILYVTDGQDIASGSPEEFKTILESGCPKAGFGMKQLAKELKGRGITLSGPYLDAELMHYLINPERSHHLEQLCSTYVGVDISSGDEPRTESLFDALPEQDDSLCKLRARAVFVLTDILSDELASSGMKSLYDDMEEPLLKVLAGMELTGVRIDPAAIRSYAGELRSRVLEKEALVRGLAGSPALNVSSPKQVGEVIYEKLRLDPKARKPKSGSWPTDEQTLLELADRSPIIDAILDFRGYKKLLSTYIEPLPGYISPSDGRVHTTFNQTLTATGRLSSSNPNLQNIPVRTEEGREIRRAFVASDADSVIMSADYSQIELRIMAHLCGDEHLVKAFREGTDIHSATAAKIYGKAPGEVTAADRRVAKTVNFGIMYGISAFGLAQRLGCSRSEAKGIIEDYFESFPSIRSFIDETVREARANGYVKTIFGRRRYLPDLESHNAQVRAFAERNAVNAPIQGSAADIIKLAMIAVERRLRESGSASRMVLQIHDELLLEVPRSGIDAARDILVSEMEGVVKLSVPLTVECNYGENWLEAH